MPYPALLSRIRKLFAKGPDAHLESIEDEFKKGRRDVPAQPMSDQELARAIREFKERPVSDWTLRKLGNRFKGF